MAETCELKLTIQNFHQCANLISTKLTTSNYLLWRSQVLPLIKSLVLEHHIIEDAGIPSKLIKEGDDKEVVNSEFVSWTNNDGLLMAWLMGMMTEDVVSMAIGGKTSRQVWLAIEEQILPATKEKESWLKDSLYSMKKGSLLLEDFLKRFKCTCGSLAAIGRPIFDEDKISQIARALGPIYADFKTAMLAKPPLPSFNQFLLALHGHEQSVGNLLMHAQQK